MSHSPWYLLRLLPVILLFSTASVGAEKEKPARILIVVDASASMNSPFGQGKATRFGMVRSALDILAASATDTKDLPDLALRIFGGTTDLADPEACSDTRLIRPFAPADQGDLETALDSIRPRGRSSLVAALEAAASDLGEPRPQDLVILILDSLDSCDGDLGPAFRRLLIDGDGAEVHILGPGLPVDDQKFAASLGPTVQPTGWPSQFKSTFLAVVSRRIPLSSEELSIPLGPIAASDFGFLPTNLEFVLPNSTEVFPVDLRVTDRIPPTLPDSATVTVVGEADDQRRQFVRTAIRPGRPLDLEPYRGPTPALDLAHPNPQWGIQPTVEVSWHGAPDEPLQLVLTRENAPGASWIESLEIHGPEGRATLPLPDRPVSAAVQLRRRHSTYAAILAERTFTAEGRRIVLRAPNRITSGASLLLEWDGETVAGDLVTVVPADASDEVLGLTFSAADGPAAGLSALLDECTYEVRYLGASTGQVLARQKVETESVAAGLQSPGQAAAGAELFVRWWGPGENADALTLSHPDDPSGDYLSWADPGLGSPAHLKVPHAPGSYEIRYLSEGDGILARLALEVKEIQVAIEAPAEVSAGRRFPLSWTGPNAPNDFLVIVPAGAPARKHRDFVFVSTGSPSSMAAPYKTGRYEIRYVSAETDEELATIEVEVVD